ncbi:MAG: tetratricopeptide repeat protein [Chloroflexi bacterium]|nr:tetratricopeptide repeat protein [Chloroflexota bacterium]
MRSLISAGLAILIALAAIGIGSGALPGALAQYSGPEPAHLVLSVDNGTDARLNRMDWDVNAWAPLVPAASVRASDYIDLSGRTTVRILCANLTVIEQRGSEVPRCDPLPDPAFVYLDDPTWTSSPDDLQVTVAGEGVEAPPEVDDPGAFTLVPLAEADRAAIVEQSEAILAVDASPEARAFALASYYRTEGLLFDAVSALTALPDLGCTERRPTVELTPDDGLSVLESPVLYLRLGELFQMLGQDEDAGRNYTCAAEIALALNDPANAALAFARRANLADDTAAASELYQAAIDNYAALGAIEQANAMLQICGLRNCTLE